MSAQQNRTTAKLVGLLGGLLMAAAGALYVTGGLEASTSGSKAGLTDPLTNKGGGKVTRAGQPVEAPVAAAEDPPKKGTFSEAYAQYMAAGDSAILVPARFNGLKLPGGWRALTDRTFGIGVDIETESVGDAIRPMKGLSLELSYKEFGTNDVAREQVTEWLNATAMWYLSRETRPDDGLARAHYFSPNGGAFDVVLDPNAPVGIPQPLDGHLLQLQPVEAELFGAMLEWPQAQHTWTFTLDSAAGLIAVNGMGTTAEMRTLLAAISKL